MKYFFWFALVVLSSACASPTYVAPTSGPTASIVYPVLKRNYSVIGGASAFGARLATQGEDGCGKLTVSKPDEEGGNLSTVVIPANKKIFVVAEIGIGNSGCNVVGSFNPVEGEVYRVVRGKSVGYCSVGVLDSKDNPVVLTKGKLDLLTGKKACEL